VDALVLTLLGLVGLVSALLFLVRSMLRENRRLSDELEQARESEVSNRLQVEPLAEKLERMVALFSAKPSEQGRLGEERLELILTSLPRRYWQRQPTLTNGNRPDFLLTLGEDLMIPVDAKLLGATAGMGDRTDIRVLQQQVSQAARNVADRYLEPSVSNQLALLVLPPGTHAGLEMDTLDRCHGLGVVPTPAEGVAALVLLLAHLTPWLPDGSKDEGQGLAATRRALKAALELLERAGRQGRNSFENLERARQVLDGARLRLEAGDLREYGGRTPVLEELLG